MERVTEALRTKTIGELMGIVGSVAFYMVLLRLGVKMNQSW